MWQYDNANSGDVKNFFMGLWNFFHGCIMPPERNQPVNDIAIHIENMLYIDGYKNIYLEIQPDIPAVARRCFCTGKLTRQPGYFAGL
jgi:hypothetical protein